MAYGDFDDFGGSDGGARGSDGISGPPQIIANATRKPKRLMSAGSAANATGSQSTALPWQKSDSDAPRIYGGNIPWSGPSVDPDLTKPDAEGTENGPPISPISNVSKGTPANAGVAPSAQDTSSAGVGASTVQAGTPALPKLAEQVKNPVLRVLGRLTGMIGPTPQLGQPYTGPISTESKIGTLGRFLGRMGDAGTMTAGSLPQKELLLQEKNLDLQRLSHLAQLAETARWHQIMGGVAQEKADVAQQRADFEKTKNDSLMRARGYVPDEQNSGAYRAMSPDEILRDPMLSLDQETKGAARAVKLQQAQLAEAHRQVLTDPSNPRFQQVEREIQGRLAMAQAGLQMRMQSQAIAGYNQLINTGYNAASGERLGQGPSPVPGWMPTDAQGNPVPLKTYGAIPSQARYRSLQAKTLMPLVEQVQQSLEFLNSKDQLGPIAGRANNFLTGKLKLSDPDYQAFLSQWNLLQTALMNAHVGARGSEAILQHFASLIDGAMPFENSQASLTVIGNYLDKEVGTMTPIPGPINRAAQSHNQSGGQGGSSGTVRFTDAGKVYNIPSNLVDGFKQDHPNAR